MAAAEGKDALFFGSARCACNTTNPMLHETPGENLIREVVKKCLPRRVALQFKVGTKIEILVTTLNPKTLKP
jgi:hypothetical protein